VEKEKEDQLQKLRLKSNDAASFADQMQSANNRLGDRCNFLDLKIIDLEEQNQQLQKQNDHLAKGIVAEQHKKPWTLSPPPEGQQWHRTDWTEEMLPEGYRPLLLNEQPLDGDEVFKSPAWFKQEIWELEYVAVSDHYHERTRRPLPPTEPVLVPLDMNDIRATDEFRIIGGCVIQTVTEWDATTFRLSYGGQVNYLYLAANYLRRQHGSTEWKPCTKEAQQ